MLKETVCDSFATMSEIRIGLIGCGNLGRVHTGCVAKLDGASMQAFADTSQPAADALCADFGGRYATTDSERLLSDPQIDAIYICTRHDSHAPLAIAAAGHGKHILIEKPLALSLPECEAVRTAVEEAGVILMPAFKMRYYPLIRRAHEFIPNPRIVVGQMMDKRWPDDGWAQDPIQGGANVFSQGCHTTDIIRYLAGGEPQRIWAVGGAISHPGHPCIDQCAASILFSNGCLASWVQGDAALGHFTSKFFMQVFGDGRCVQLYDRFKQATFSEGDRSWTETREDEEGFQLENEEFVMALREGRAPELASNDGIQATRIVLGADAAIRSGAVQEL